MLWARIWLLGISMGWLGPLPLGALPATLGPAALYRCAAGLFRAVPNARALDRSAIFGALLASAMPSSASGGLRLAGEGADLQGGLRRLRGIPLFPAVGHFVAGDAGRGADHRQPAARRGSITARPRGAEAGSARLALDRGGALGVGWYWKWISPRRRCPARAYVARHGVVVGGGEEVVVGRHHAGVGGQVLQRLPGRWCRPWSGTARAASGAPRRSSAPPPSSEPIGAGCRPPCGSRDEGHAALVRRPG